MIRTGVIGLGLIGSIRARHLHDDGWLSAVWNRTPKPEFPRWVANATDVPDRSDVVILCVSDPLAVDVVLRRIESRLAARHVLI